MGVRIDPASLSRWFRRNGYRYKKTLLASEQDRPDVAAARCEWIAKRQPRMRREAHRLVFVDETGTSTKMVRTRGRCAKSQRLKGHAPFGHWKTQTFIAGLRRNRLTAPFVVDQPMNRLIFETWVQTQLAQPSPRVMSLSSTTWPLTKVQLPNRPSALGVRGCSFCRPTVRTSIRSRWPSQSSRHIYVPAPPEPSTICGKPSAISATSSSPTNAETISTPPDMDSPECTML